MALQDAIVEAHHGKAGRAYLTDACVTVERATTGGARGSREAEGARSTISHGLMRAATHPRWATGGDMGWAL